MKDKFTRAEIVEFLIGIILTLTLSYVTLDSIAQRFNTKDDIFYIKSILLFVITASIAVGILKIRNMDKIVLRAVTAIGMSALIAPIFLYLFFGVNIADRLDLYIVTICASTIGALTIDILRDDD